MNYFLTSSESGYHHLVIYVENLVSAGVLRWETVQILVVGEVRNNHVRSFSNRVRVSALSHPLKLDSNDSLTLLSLNQFIECDARKIIAYNLPSIKNIYCLITDDEVHRWSDTYKNEKSGVQFLQCIAGSDLGYCLEHLRTFICQHEPWGRVIKDELSIPGSIVDVVPPFTIIDRENELKVCVNSLREQRGGSSLRVMLYTKKVLHSELAKLISTMRRSSFLETFTRLELTLWCDPLTRNLQFIREVFYLKAWLKAREIDFCINYVSNLSASAYLEMVVSQDLVFCQPRGGGSAVRALVRAAGTPIFAEDSFNQENFSEFYVGDNFLTYNTEKDTVSSYSFDVGRSYNASNRLQTREAAAVYVLKELYKC